MKLAVSGGPAANGASSPTVTSAPSGIAAAWVIVVVSKVTVNGPVKVFVPESVVVPLVVTPASPEILPETVKPLPPSRVREPPGAAEITRATETLAPL